MPWSPGDADSKKKNLAPAAKRRWASIANKVLTQTGNDGQAVRIANGATRSNSAIKRKLKNGVS